MNTQKLITGGSRKDWEYEVNKYLQEGWKIVPGTLNIQIASEAGNGFYQPYTTQVFVVVVEK